MPPTLRSSAEHVNQRTRDLLFPEESSELLRTASADSHLGRRGVARAEGLACPERSRGEPCLPWQAPMYLEALEIGQKYDVGISQKEWRTLRDDFRTLQLGQIAQDLPFR